MIKRSIAVGLQENAAQACRSPPCTNHLETKLLPQNAMGNSVTMDSPRARDLSGSTRSVQVIIPPGAAAGSILQIPGQGSTTIQMVVPAGRSVSECSYHPTYHAYSFPCNTFSSLQAENRGSRLRHFVPTLVYIDTHTNTTHYKPGDTVRVQVPLQQRGSTDTNSGAPGAVLVAAPSGTSREARSSFARWPDIALISSRPPAPTSRN